MHMIIHNVYSKNYNFTKAFINELRQLQHMFIIYLKVTLKSIKSNI